MKLPLPVRIFLIHMVFMLALGGLGALLVQQTFRRYERAWRAELETLPAEKLFSPLASELARSLLLRLEQGLPEPQDEIKSQVGAGLDRVLPLLPAIDRLVIVAPDLSIQYTNRPLEEQFGLSDEAFPADLVGEDPLRRQVRLRSGDEVTEVAIPLFADVARKDRLGTALVHYGREPELEAALLQLYGDRTTATLDEVSLLEHALNPFIQRIGRDLLLERLGDPTGADSYQISVSDGLTKVIKAAPLESLLIVDKQHRIQYVNDPQFLDLTLKSPEIVELLSEDEPVRRSAQLSSGQSGVEVMLPVYDVAGPSSDAAPRRRLGSLMIRFRPDPTLLARVPEISQPRIRARDYLQPLTLFLAVAVASGILLAGLTGLPVRRVERALADFRRRGFQGELDTDHAGLPSELASTLQTVNELGGKLQAMDALGREREALLATLSQSLEDGMVALDPSGQPVSWNPAALRILVGSDLAAADGEADEERLLRGALERSSDLEFSVAREAAHGTTREVEISHSDQHRTLARMTQHPIALGPGVTGTLLFFRDLGALRKVESHLLDAGRFASLAHLAAGLAHEIRNPLHAIQLNASVVEQYSSALTRGPESTAVAESLAVVQQEARRLTDLLNNYLGMLRPGEDAAPVDLPDLCRKVIQLVSYEAGRSHIELRLEGEDDVPMVFGVSDRLQQAILNLVLNAIQAMPDGGVITLQTSTYAETIRLTVSDTGPGLPQALSDQLFDTRVTTKPEGSGLGLPLVRLIAESHGGGVWYRSQPGQGATFTLVLPRPVAGH